MLLRHRNRRRYWVRFANADNEPRDTILLTRREARRLARQLYRGRFMGPYRGGH